MNLDDVLPAMVVIAGVLVSGMALRAALGPLERARPQVWGEAFGLGLTWFALWIIALAALSISATAIQLAVGWVIPIGLVVGMRLWKRKSSSASAETRMTMEDETGSGIDAEHEGNAGHKRDSSHQGNESSRSALAEWFGFVPCLLVFLVAMWLATSRPVWNVDAMTRWVMHGQWLAEQGTVLPEHARDENWRATHPTYPPLVPALIGTALKLGADKDEGLRLLFPFFLLALLAIVYGFARERAGPWFASGVALALALTPGFFYLDRDRIAWGLGADAAMADLPLAFLLTGAATSGLAFANRPRPSKAILLATFLIGSALTKQEGLAASALMLLILGLALGLRRSRRKSVVTGIVPVFVVYLSIAGAWAWLSRDFPIEDGENYLDSGLWSTALAGFDRLPTVLNALLAEWTRFELWGPSWLLLLLVPIGWWWPKGARTRDGRWQHALLSAWLLGSLALIVGAYLISGWKKGDYEGLIGVSLTRLLMHHAPLLWLILIQLAAESPQTASARLDLNSPLADRADRADRAEAKRAS